MLLLKTAPVGSSQNVKKGPRHRRVCELRPHRRATKSLLRLQARKILRQGLPEAALDQGRA